MVSTRILSSISTKGWAVEGDAVALCRFLLLRQLQTKGRATRRE
jgi:hypothetical protein